jgi:hypothetical protein
MRDPDWLINSTPREVQMEALRRSYGGFGTRDRLEDPVEHFRLHAGAARGWCHYLQMRLGKSSLLLAEFELFHRDHNVEGLVIICPNTYKSGWLDEIEKSGTLAKRHVWERNEKDAKDLVKSARSENLPWILVFNYESVRSDRVRDLIEWCTKGIKFGLGIDESIKIKTQAQKSQQSKAVLEISRGAFFVRNLSGIPMSQGPHDLYNQFRVIGQQNGVNFYSFRNRFCKMGGYKNKVVKGAKNEEELQELLRACSFIAKTKDWGKEGEKRWTADRVEVTERQREYYRQMDEEFMVLLESGEEVTVDVVISKMLKLAQISSGFIYDEGKVHFFEEPLRIPKVQRLLEIMEEVNGKVIVPYHYSASGDLLIEVLKKYNPAVIRSQQWMKVNGVDVEGEKDKLNNDPSCRVIIAQISATKYGHTIIGSEEDRCETMAFYESTYSLDDRSQIEMRNTFYNQDWTNLYIDFFGTKIEKNVADALARKESLVESVMNVYNITGENHP